jgi:hypothetical protein
MLKLSWNKLLKIIFFRQGIFLYYECGKKPFVCNFFLVFLKDSLPLRQNLGFYTK